MLVNTVGNLIPKRDFLPPSNLNEEIKSKMEIFVDLHV